MAEKTNEGVAVFVAGDTLCVWPVSGRMELLRSFLCAMCVVLEHSPTSCNQLQFKALPGHSVDVDSFHISYADIFI